MRCYVIGDIHGCPDELACLLGSLPLEPDDRLVFLGDYIDRGPDSKGVVSYLIDCQSKLQQKMIFLKGNHEDMFLAYLGLGGHYADMFLYNGGSSTLLSYGISGRVTDSREILSRIPDSHLEFYRGLKSYFLVEPFLCVHAGVHPLKPLNEQSEEELLWIRNKFILNRHSLPFTVIFGHTPQKAVFFDLPSKIGLDTGLVYGNELSCLELQEKVLFQVPRGKKTVKQTQVQDQWRLPFRHPTLRPLF